MELTFIGAAQIALGSALWLFGSVEAMFALLLVSALFGGSAAMALPALGGSSVPPVHFALVFLALRLLTPGGGRVAALGPAARANLWLGLFVIWGVTLALIGPQLFAGHIAVTPMRGKTSTHYGSMLAYVYATKPLAFSSQNLTTAIYLVGTLIAAMAASVVCAGERGRLVLVRTMAVVGASHALFGFLSVIGGPDSVIQHVLVLFRNGTYAQLDYAFMGFSRMSGLWPEASGFAWFGVTWFVFVFECWLRRVEPWWTGLAALLLAAALGASVATTAYVGLGIYAVLLVARWIVFPPAISTDRTVMIAAALMGLVVLIAGVMIVDPRLADRAGGLLRHMTIDKGQSLSGTQRLFWARQGLEAFAVSDGIGIGPGSFRSSSLLTAIIGCTGIIGIVTFTAHLVRMFKPLRLSTYCPSEDRGLATGAACAWAALINAMVASLSSPTCDPGTDFAILAGAALAMRALPAQRTGWRPLLPRLPILNLSPGMALPAE